MAKLINKYRMKERIVWYLLSFFAFIGIDWTVDTVFYKLEWISHEPDLLSSICTSVFMIIVLNIFFFWWRRRERRK